MRSLLHVAVPLAAAVVAGCAGPAAKPPPVKESPAAVVTPRPDPACAGNVQRALLATNLEQVQVKVTLLEKGAVRLSLLAPDLTPSQAEEMRRALSKCLWKPGANGQPTGTITFGRAQ